MTIIDWYTEFTMAYSLHHVMADKTAWCVLNFMCTFGVPLELYSDNAKNLNGSVIQSLCKLIGVTKLSTVP